MKVFPSYEEEKHYYEVVASEEEFLQWYQMQDKPTYETPSLTVDSMMFSYNREREQLQLLLIKRKVHPFREKWAIPGGFVKKNESTEETCRREVKEETNVSLAEDEIEQLYIFSEPHRDPRGWVVTVAYLAFIEKKEARGGDDALEAKWFDVSIKDGTITLIHGKETIVIAEDSGMCLSGNIAFDHGKIISKGYQSIKDSLYKRPIFLHVLGKRFSMREIRKLYGIILGISYETIDQSNFRKTTTHLFQEIGESTGKKVGRPSKLYTLK